MNHIFKVVFIACFILHSHYLLGTVVLIIKVILNIFVYLYFIDQLLSNTAIYCALGGTVIFIIGIVLCLSYISWKKILANSRRLHDLSSSQIPTEMPNRQSNINEENDYEEIDEEKMIEEPMVSDIETISTTSSTDKSVYGGADSDGYLHPYHSLVTENHLGTKLDEGTESTSEDIYEYKKYQKISKSVEEQDASVCATQQSFRNKGIPVQKILVMPNEYRETCSTNENNESAGVY